MGLKEVDGMSLTKKKGIAYQTKVFIATLLYIVIQFFDIPYVERYLNTSIKGVLYLFCTAFMFLIYISRGVKKYTEIFLFAILMIFFLVSTLIQNNSYLQALLIILPLISTAFLFLMCKNEKEVLSIIKLLELFYLAIILIDAVTMAIYPNGLYSDKLYSAYWFLGYKTQRMPFIISLLVSDAYRHQIERKGLKSSIILAVFTLFVLQKTDSMSSIGGLVFFIFAVVLVSLTGSNNKAWRSIMRIFLDFRLFIIVYTIVFLTFVVSQDMDMVSDLLLNTLNRSITVSGRTWIWANCLEYFRNKPLFGYGILTSTQYVGITGIAAGTNAHNMVLTYLMSGGIVGTAVFIYLNFRVMKGTADTVENCILIAGVYAIFIIGISSSIMSLDSSLYGIYFLLLVRRSFKCKTISCIFC